MTNRRVADTARELTPLAARRPLIDPLSDIDRLWADREVARIIARLLYEHERRHLEHRSQTVEQAPEDHVDREHAEPAD